MRHSITRDVLRREVQIEAGLSTNVSHTLQNEERINHLLNRMERQMEMEYDWPPLNTEANAVIAANATAGTLPATLSFTSVNEVWCEYGEGWVEVKHGIGLAERNSWPDTARATPIQRWEILGTDTAQRDFAVWPTPNQEQTLRFIGQKAVGQMADDADSCTLDGDALVLRTAGFLLAEKSSEKAALLLKEADAQVKRILHRQVGKKMPNINFAAGANGGYNMRDWRDDIPPGTS